MPLLRLRRAPVPSAVLVPSPTAPSAALALCGSANKARPSANRTTGKPRRKREWLMRFGTSRVAVLRGIGRFIGSFLLFSRLVTRLDCKPGKRRGATRRKRPGPIQVLFDNDYF